MSFDHPHTPQSPSNLSSTNLPPKPTSPQTTTSLPTPAHSINGSLSSSLGSDMASDQAQFEDGSHKRKRDLEDHGNQEQKKVHVEDSRFGIDDLHIDVGPKYLLCKTPHEYVRPNPTHDFFALYGLYGIASTVSRFKPDGEKNVLRKSYKGQLKAAGISGTWDAVKKDTFSTEALFGMMMVPQEEWDMQFRGKEIEKGIPEAARASLGKAMTMAKGNISRDDWDHKVLGELVVKEKTGAEKARVGVKTAHAVTQNPAVSKAVKGEIPRPKRNIKKRTYGDTSFEGYGEGYVDDEQELDDGGYSTGDGGAGQKRRKKVGIVPEVVIPRLTHIRTTPTTTIHRAVAAPMVLG
ncbi:hypothetical protein BP6252_07421 [Coleophoma cylindrospora]|uniref:Mediator of RNA polymerase II transcription subunit 19 n=1 Tax=Coleophoma cylindrospora TaxID=1849047 RepID=A0A3D8RHZ7_9HELO|nr:hypothetical protein BP6252_07421 [Coleophoma cylindrospora]